MIKTKVSPAQKIISGSANGSLSLGTAYMINGMMTWEETIQFLRGKLEYSDILFNSYLNDDAAGNVKRFMDSAEFKETLNLIKSTFPHAVNLLEIGSGTGTSAAAFSLSGFNVTASEPDPGQITGCKSIHELKIVFNLQNFNIVQTHGENLPFDDESFDIVYARQTLHHATDLFKLISETSRVLKPRGAFIAVREHVIFNESDKKQFLVSHPLQKYYGGENAFYLHEYINAFETAGMKVDKKYGHFDSVINYFPLTLSDIEKLEHNFNNQLNKICTTKFGSAGKLKVFQYIYRKINMFRFGSALDERRIPGRMYSFIAHKP